MPSKPRWTLNPRKWFGTITNAAHKREKKSQINNPVPPPPPPVITRTVPRHLTGRNITKVTPSSNINDNHHITQSTNPLTSFQQFQLPAFGVRREKTTLLSTSTSFNRRNALVPIRTQPSIRKNGEYNKDLTVVPTRWNTPKTLYDTSKILLLSSLSSEYGNFQDESLSEKPIDMNLSNISQQCLIDYSQNDSKHNLLEKCSSLTRTHSSSSIDDSSSIGIFTDERTDLNDQQRTASKDTLSNVEVLSIDSITDSQLSLNYSQSRPVIHHYRLTMLGFENKSAQQHKTYMSRSHSAENILKENRIYTPILTKSRQSSAAIVKKIEKRCPISRSPPATLEKAGFKRITTDTYRLTIDKDDHLYRRQRRNSIIQYTNYDDSLPPANNEECYAGIPHTSSTEQLNTNIQNDLRAIIDDCLRPIVASVGKATGRSIKTHHRSKRSHPIIDSPQIDIEHITDRLLSSIDCSTYAQYQRCY